ncbi:MAG: hypothetical protein K2O03_01470 [Lachnospiraceae bacterium]|nr:hypothetical protein [Lachnospiraceae bacterium]
MLILCPECSHSISDQALACPNCGYPVAIIPNTRRRAHSTRRKLPNGTGSIKTAAGKNRIVPIHDAILPFARDFSPGSFRASVFRSNKFYPALEQLGISYTANGKKHTPHDCRHTFSWLCDRYGVDNFSKHLLMGHSFGNDIEKSVYGHRTLEELRAEIGKIHTGICR